MSGTKPLTLTMRPEAAKLLAQLAPMRPWERCVAAGRLREELMATRGALAEVRRQAAMEMREMGMTWQEIADLVGMSKQKAHANLGHPVRPGGRAEASEA